MLALLKLPHAYAAFKDKDSKWITLDRYKIYK